MKRNLLAGVALACFCAAAAGQPAGAAANTLHVSAAHVWADPTHAMLLDVAHAGKRIVAVGEHGIVLLSDDGGRSYRQAKQVPASSTLTAICFTDALHGWAVGQWGALVHDPLRSRFARPWRRRQTLPVLGHAGAWPSSMATTKTASTSGPSTAGRGRRARRARDGCHRR